MKKPLLFIGTIVLAVLLHIATQYYAFSLFLAPASISLLIVLIDPLPIFFVIAAFLLLELYSTLPAGSMFFVFGIPFAMRYLWSDSKPDITWKFFFFMLATITLQIAALAGMSVAGASFSFTAIPWAVLILQALITSVCTFVLAFIYREYSS